MENNYEIEIVDSNAIEGGVQVFMRAWKNGSQLGFGVDGTVDIERVRMINPPIYVDDPLGDIIVDETYTPQGSDTPVVKTRTMKEDPVEATHQSLVGVARVAGKGGSNIIPGKTGNTITTVRPSAGTTAPVDGYVANNNATYLTARNAATGNAASATGAFHPFGSQWLDSGQYYVRRGIVGFDSTDVGTDTISSAVLTLYGSGNAVANTDTETVNIVSAIGIASTSAISTADFDIFGTTSYASMTLASWDSVDGNPNDFTLDSAGIAHIDTWSAGIGFFGGRLSRDIAGTAPSSGGNEVQPRYADVAGTASDPVLVMTHSAGGGGGFTPTPMMHMLQMAGGIV